MAERTLVPEMFCFPVPSGLDDDTGCSVAEFRGFCVVIAGATGETVLLLGATGVTGQLAVQIAKLLGAKKVVGVGRNQRVLARLGERGAGATI